MVSSIVPEETLRGLAEAAGYRHDRSIQSALEHLYVDPDGEDVEDMAELARDFRATARLEGREPHPFLPSPPPDVLAAGEIPVGTLPWYGDPVAVPLAGHKYVAGTTGAGKTTLVELILLRAFDHGLRVVVFDPEGQFPVDIGGLFPREELYVVDADSYLVNPFQPPPSLTPRQWVGWTANVEREAWYYRRGAENFSNNVKVRVLDSGNELTLPSFLQAVKASEPGKGAWREHQYFESVRTVAESLLMFLPGLGVARSRGLDEIFSRRAVIFDWSKLENSQNRKYLTLHALSWLLASRFYEPDRRPDSLVVFDEVSLLASVELQNMSDISEPFFVVAMRRSRKKGFSFVTLDQNPSHTHKVARANADTKIVLELTEGRDKAVMAADFDLNPEQRAYLGALQPREAVVKLPHVPEPFIVHIPEVSHD